MNRIKDNQSHEKLLRFVTEELKNRSRDMPWARDMKIELVDMGKYHELVIVFPSALFVCMSAGTFLRNINAIAARSAPTIRRVIACTGSARHHKRNSARRISWKVNHADHRKKNLNRWHYSRFHRYLVTEVFEKGVLANPSDRQKEVLNDVFNGFEAQRNAIYRMICHQLENGYIGNGRSVRLDDLFSLSNLEKAAKGYAGQITRYLALDILKNLQMVEEPRRQQAPLRPPFEVASHTIVIRFLEVLLADETGWLCSGARDCRSSYARHLAAYIFHRTTNKSQEDIAEYLGRSDHTTALNSIRRIEKYCQEHEHHRGLVNVLCDVVDSIGIYQVSMGNWFGMKRYEIVKTPEGLELHLIDEPPLV